MPTFLNPWMLLGGLAVGIPVALHFFYRARYRPLPWGAMKFLRLAIEQTSRRLRFQELILLILRILICLILAAALARPASKTLSSGSGRGESVDAILIVDTSYSMAAKETEKQSRLDRAKEAAIKVIDNLPPNSTVQVIACSDKAGFIGPNTPTNLDQARHLIRNLKVTSRSTDFEAGFGEAISRFEKTTGANKEVYLFSDMQRSGWERQTTALRSKAEEIKNQASLYLVRCAEKKVKNVAVVGIMTQTDVPHVDTRLSFTVLLRNSGAEPVAGLKLTFEVDGKALGGGAADGKSADHDSRPVDKIGPGETKAVSITGKIDKPGLRLLTARIKEDDLEEDNEYNRFLMVREKVRVLVIDGAPNERDPTAAASFYLANALVPVLDEVRPTYHILPRVISAQVASAGALAGNDICILCNVDAARLPADFTRKLISDVQSGKGLLITAGNNVVAKDYNAVFKDLLPAPLADAGAFTTPEGTFLKPDLNSIDKLSFLGKFVESGNNPLRDLGDADTRTVIQVKDPRTETATKDAGRVLLRFTDGKPMLLSRAVGDGEVMLLTTTLDYTWSYLPNNTALVPALHGCLAYMSQKAGGSFNGIVTKPLVWQPPDAGKDYYLIKPDKERVRLGRPKDVDGRPTLTAREADTSRAGIYEIVTDDDKPPARFALIPDLRESENLEAFTDQQINEQLGFSPTHLSTGFDGSAFTGTERSRKEWTIWVLTALLIFAVGEMLWAWFCGRSW
jgi:hypothetical protein